MPTSLAGQTTEELGGAGSVLALQRRDHIDLDRLMNGYWSAGEPDRTQLLREITQLVFSHAFAEETVLWPVVRKTVPDGEELTREVEREHQEINEVFADLDRHEDDRPAYDRCVTRLFSLVRQDIRDEEDKLLPRLQEALDTRRLVQLGTAWEMARLTAPTRPHPAVPRRPPGNAVLGLPLTVYDRARDLLAPAGRPAPGRVAALGAAALGGAVLLRRATGRRRGA